MVRNTYGRSQNFVCEKDGAVKKVQKTKTKIPNCAKGFLVGDQGLRLGVAATFGVQCRWHQRNSPELRVWALPPTKAPPQTIQGEHPEKRELTRRRKPSEQVACEKDLPQNSKQQHLQRFCQN